MKSKITFLFFLFIFSLKIFGQTELPNGMVYYFRLATYGAGNTGQYGYTDTIRLDSTVAGKKYYSFSWIDFKQVMVNGNKIYLRNHKDSMYKLIYDFDLKKGDKIPGYSYIDTLQIDSVKSLAIGTDTVIVQYAHVIKINYLYENFYTFVNRIGSLEAGIEYWNSSFFETDLLLLGLCTQNETIQWIERPELHFIKSPNCSSMDSIIHIISVPSINKNANVVLSPNPVGDQLKVETLNLIEYLTIEIYNTLGSLVYQIKSTDAINTIDLNDFENGLYIVKITTSDNQYSTQKIIKQ